MSRLFVDLYLDEDVDPLIARLVRKRRFRAVTAGEAHLLRATDDRQLAYAAEHEMAILTHNRNHFLALARRYIEQERTHWGIIIAARRRSSHEVARRLLELLDDVTADEMCDQVRYI